MVFGNYVQKVTLDNQLLRDYDFLRRFEGIRSISAFIYLTLVSYKAQNGSAIPLFEKKGIKTLEEYLGLLDKNNWAAVKYYNNIKKILEKHFEYKTF